MFVISRNTAFTYKDKPIVAVLSALYHGRPEIILTDPSQWTP